MSRLGVKLLSLAVVVCITCRLVISYESVYDIIEERNKNRYFDEPRNRYQETRERVINMFNDYNRYPTFNGEQGSIYSTVHPIGRDGFSPFWGGAKFFGNGYDNLGNGHLPRRDIFREPPYAKNYNLRFDRGYHKKEYPIFHDNYYFIGPRIDERSLRQNSDKIYEGSHGQKENSATSRMGGQITKNQENKQQNMLENFKSGRVSVLSDSIKKDNFGEKSQIDRNGENKSTISSNRVSKKGHVTKGFSTHHHKDETGNSTTYYDEYADHGGQSDFKDAADGFGTRTTMEHFSDTNDEKFFKENGGQTGNYGSGHVQDQKKTEKDFVFTGSHFGRDETFQLEDGNANFGHRRDSYKSGGRQGFDEYGLPYDNNNYYYH